MATNPAVRGILSGSEGDDRGAVDGAAVHSRAAEIVTRRDPLAHSERLIRSVYAYVAYRVGPGADAEDITSETFERALRYRDSYDPGRGEPLAWLIGIARRCVDGAFSDQLAAPMEGLPERAAPDDVAEDTLRRLTLAAAVAKLDERDRELIALRYGADLSGRQIGELLDMRAGAVDVAMHRALERLRRTLESSTEFD